MGWNFTLRVVLRHHGAINPVFTANHIVRSHMKVAQIPIHMWCGPHGPWEGVTTPELLLQRFHLCVLGAHGWFVQTKLHVDGGQNLWGIAVEPNWLANPSTTHLGVLYAPFVASCWAWAQLGHQCWAGRRVKKCACAGRWLVCLGQQKQGKSLHQQFRCCDTFPWAIIWFKFWNGI